MARGASQGSAALGGVRGVSMERNPRRGVAEVTAARIDDPCRLDSAAPQSSLRPPRRGLAQVEWYPYLGRSARAGRAD